MDAFLKFGLLGLSAAAAVVAAVLSVAGPAGYSLIGWVVAGALLCASVIARSPRIGVLLTSIGSFASAAYLFSRKWESAQATQSLCNISEVLNCDVVNTSAASEVGGIPITLFGMGLYAGLGVAAIVADDASKRFFQVTGWLAIASIAYSVFLAWQSYVIGSLCVMCISMYIGHFLLLWAAVAGLKRIGSSLTDGIGDLLPSRDFLTVAATFVVVVAVGAYTWQAQESQAASRSPLAQIEPGKTAPPEVVGRLYEQPEGQIQLDGTEPVLGNPAGRYLIVEWADYGCPHCATAWAELKQLLGARTDLQLRYKVFPLTGDCNPAIEGSRGPERCLAAYAADCARHQGRFADMATLLFENQGYFSPEDLEYMAHQAKLDVARWKQCMAAPDTAAGVVADAQAGVTAGVHGTPALYLKGTHGEQWLAIKGGPAEIGAILDAHASGAQLPPPGPPTSHGH